MDKKLKKQASQLLASYTTSKEYYHAGKEPAASNNQSAFISLDKQVNRKSLERETGGPQDIPQVFRAQPYAQPGTLVTGQHEEGDEPEFYKFLVETIQEPIFLISPGNNFRFSYVNPATCRHYGLSAEQLLTMSIPDWDPAFSWEDCYRFSQVMREKKRMVFETMHRHSSGEILPVEISATLFYYQGKEYYAGYIKDLRERKKTEAALRESEERYATTVNASDLGLWDFDITRQRIVLSGQMAKIFGCASNEAMSNADFFASLHPDDREVQEKLFNSIVAGEIKGRFSTEHRIIQQNSGAIRWVKAVGMPFFDDTGVIVRTVGTIADITDQKLAELQVKTLQEQLKITIENIPSSIYLFDGKGKVLFANKQAIEDMRGLLAEEFSPDDDITVMLQKGLHRVIVQNEEGRTLALAEAPLQVALHTGMPSELLFKRIYKNTGCIQWMLVRVSPVKDEHGKVQLLVSSNTDVTLQKITETALRESEERYRNLFASNKDPLLLIDMETGNIVDVNPAACVVYGYTREELLTLKNTDISAEPDKTLASMQAKDTTVPLRYHRKKSGDIFPVELTISHLQMNRRDTAIITARDITEKLKAAHQTQVEKERLELALLAGNLGLWDWDITSGQIIYNDRLIYTLGYTLSELGKDFTVWQDLIHPKDRSYVLQTLQAHLEGQLPYYQAEYRIRGKNGNWKWIMDRGKVILRREDGKPLRAVGTFLDITFKRNAEEKIRFEALLLGLLDEGVIALNTDFIIKSWSAGAENIFKLPAPKVLGLPLPQVLTIKYYEEQLGHVLGDLSQMGNTWKGEVIIQVSNGEVCRTYITFSVIDEGQENGYILVCRNIEEISAIQHRLIEQQSYIISAIENSADAIFALNANFELLYFNTAYKNDYINQIQLPLSIGSNLMDISSEKGKNQLLSDWERVKKGDKFFYDYTYTLPGGDLQYFEVHVNPIYGIKQEVLGASYMYRDVTERRRMNQEMQRMQEEILHTRLQEQKIHATSLLEGQELERIRLGRELHDGIGQMLNALKMQMVRESASAGMLQRVDEIIADIIRVNNNLMPAVLQDFGLHAGIKHLIENYRRITEPDFYFFSDIENKRFDSRFESNVFRVVQEALSNAVKYAKASSISVQITLQAHSLLIMIEDDGIGFDPEKLSKKDNKGGYGLLNMKFRVEALHGKIVTETSPNRGCVINIELPV